MRWKVCVIVILVVLLLYLAACFVITALTFKVTFRASKIEPYSSLAHWDHYEQDYERREVSFPSGDNTLRGYIYTAGRKENKAASSDRKGLLVFSHGIWSGHEEYMTLLTWLLDQGWDIFAYDYTAYNNSEGTWARGLPQSMLDLHAALTYIEGDPSLSEMPKLLLGHSWGAYATASVLAFGHDVKGAVALSGFSDPMEISMSSAESMLGRPGRMLGWTIRLFNRVIFGENARRTAVDGINAVNVPVLLLHGANDDFIRLDSTSIISHMDEITNDKVETILLDDPLQSAHNNYFGNQDSTLYYQEIMKQYGEIEKQYPKKEVPEDVRKEFFRNIDLDRANQPNVALYEQIEDFLERALA